MFLDDVDYLVVMVPCFIHPDSSLPKRRSTLTHLAPCHDHPALTCIALHLGHPALPLMCTYASYRLVGERGRTRGVGGDTRNFREDPRQKESYRSARTIGLAPLREACPRAF